MYRNQHQRATLCIASVFAIGALTWLLGECAYSGCIDSLRDSLQDSRRWLVSSGGWCVLAAFVGIGLLYAVLLCLPFVPGVELGLLMMLLLGPRGVLAAYLFTVLGLTFAFALGRWLGGRRVDPAAAARRLRETATCKRLLACLPARAVSHPLTPSLITGLAFNLPGNALVGGGGGVAMLVGASRTLTWAEFLFTVVLATAPVPLLSLAGVMQIDTLFN